jgi:hypothetical protein
MRLLICKCFIYSTRQHFMGIYVSSRNNNFVLLPTRNKFPSPETTHFIASVMICFPLRMQPSWLLAAVVTVQRLTVIVLMP